jgi:hypothetical protein
MSFDRYRRYRLRFFRKCPEPLLARSGVKRTTWKILWEITSCYVDSQYNKTRRKEFTYLFPPEATIGEVIREVCTERFDWSFVVSGAALRQKVALSRVERVPVRVFKGTLEVTGEFLQEYRTAS